MVKDLHTLLERAAIAGPFVFVGHSFGGLNARLYAATFPKEVVGMVLLDSIHEEETAKWLAMIPTEIRQQMEAAGGRQLLGGEAVDVEASVKQVQAANWRTSIPLIVIARGKASYTVEDYPPPLRSLAPKGEELRIELQQNLATRSTNGSFMFAEKSGHMIQENEPEVVIAAIKRVVEAKQK